MSKVLVTHNSSFHTDDIFAVATLLLVESNLEIIRTRDKEKINSADYVVDVGFINDASRQRFDHHQPGGAGVRENGIQYASFGLVWKAYGSQLTGGEREAGLIDRELAQPVDAHDNGMAIVEYKFLGVRDYAIGDYFSSFIESRDTEHLNQVFVQCVGMAKELLLREIRIAKKTIADQDKVSAIYNVSQDKRVIVLDAELSGWREILAKTPEALYAVHPRPDGNWGINCVPDFSKPQFGVNRKSFPVEWGGKAGEDVQSISGVPDALFVHRGLFMASAKTKDGAIALAERAANA